MFLSQFSPIRPRFQILQEDAVAKLVELRLALNPAFERSVVEKLIRRFGLANSKIKSRGTEIADYSSDSSAEKNENLGLAFFKDRKQPDLETSMLFYLNATDRVFQEWYGVEAKYLPSHLIHVSCTGYTSPNSAQKMAALWTFKGASQDKNVVVTNAYQMGCYAAFPAIRIASGFAHEISAEMKSKKKLHSIRIDIAHNELCSLHFDPFSLEPEQIVVQSLFADGHIRYTLTADRPELGFEIECLKEEVIPDSSALMSWIPSSTHFKMHLSREVPETIGKHVKSFVARLLDSSKHTPQSHLIFAIHPGGPKIIENVEAVLGLTPESTQESHEVLAEFGNMSSATLPHIWDRILKNPTQAYKNATVVSLAFGPGLTLSGGVFRLCRSN